MNVDIKFISDESKQLYKGMLAVSSPLSCGFDVRACFEQESLTILPGSRIKISLGIAFDLETYNSCLGAFLFSRSGLGAKRGLVVAGGVNVLDTDFRGELFAFMLNTSTSPITITKGERIAQIVFQEIIRPNFNVVDKLSSSSRDLNGFGSTGRM